MKKHLKRIIAILICISLFICIDNFSELRRVVSYIGNEIIVKAKNLNDKDVNEASDEDAEVSDSFDAQNEEETEEGFVVEEETYPIFENETVISEAETVADGNTELVADEVEEEAKGETKEEINKENEEATSVVVEANPSNENETRVATVERTNDLYKAQNYESLSSVSNITEGTTYGIRSVSDWTALAAYSQTSSLETNTFIVYKRDSSYFDYTLTNVKIGNQTYPFAGTIYCYYSTLQINVNTPLFDYLSSKARIGAKINGAIYKFILNYTATTNLQGCLANNLVIDKDGCDINIGGATSQYYFKLVNSAISASSLIGGLFGNVYVEDDATTGEYNITFDATNSNRSDSTDIEFGSNGSLTLQGKVVGGLVGKIHGQISVTINGLTDDIKQVTGTGSNNSEAFAGSVFGYVYDGVNITFGSGIESPTNVINSANNTGYYAGGIVGYLKNSFFYCSDGLLRTGNTKGAKLAGSIIGLADNSVVSISNVELADGIYVWASNNGTNAENFGAGGVIGKYYADEASTAYMELSFIKTTNKNASISASTSIIAATNQDNNNANYDKVGGLVGIIDAGSAAVNIHDINTDADISDDEADGGENCLVLNMRYAANNTSFIRPRYDAGGIAGNIAGLDITIDNVIFKYVNTSNTMSGYNVGCVAGQTGIINGTDRDTKIILSNVNVYKYYCYYVYNYHGGLFGYVNNSIISLQNEMNLSGVPYETQSNDVSNDNDRRSAIEDGKPLMLGVINTRGFVAGGQKQSLIYVAGNCNYTKPISYNDDGTVAEFDSDTLVSTSQNTAKNYNPYSFCIDEVGNAGTVFYDTEDIIDMYQPFGEEVTGDFDSDGEYYIIDSENAALRLAIAGNSVDSTGKPVFAGNCFVGDGMPNPTLAEILSYKYKITNDLDLSEKNINGFVYNDNMDYPFTGTLEGENSGDSRPVITMAFVSRQYFGGLFPCSNGGTFKNLVIEGNIFYTRGFNSTDLSSGKNRAAAGTLAAYGIGTNTIEGVDIKTAIKTSMVTYTTWTDNYSYCYGGAFGYYYGGAINCTDSLIAPVFNSIKSDKFVGGLVGWYRISSTSKANINITDCTLSTEIVTDENYNYGSTNTYRRGRYAGLISHVSKDYNSMTSNNLISNLASNGDETYATFTISNLLVDGVKLDITNLSAYTQKNAIATTGGILGAVWMNAEVSIDGLTIDNNTTINSRGMVGGLVSFMGGRLEMKDVAINSLTMNDLGNVNEYADYCGMLVGNGQNAFVTINGYYIDSSNVTVTNYDSFDEIVGISYFFEDGSLFLARNNQIKKNYINGGIVNIVENNFDDFSSASFTSYTNKVWNKNNEYTRYYYNLFTGDENEWIIDASGNDANITNEKQLLSFSVGIHASTNIKRFFLKYQKNNKIQYLVNIRIKNDLDLNGYSYYPITGGTSRHFYFNNHKITFYGKEIKNNEEALYSNGSSLICKDNESENSQHYLMHAGFMSNNEGNTDMHDLTLSGTVANLGANTGALICGGITGTVKLDNIIMNQLEVEGYSDGQAGLLLGHVGIKYNGIDATTNLTLDKIYTTGYTGSHSVASSLIGSVGGDSATAVKITFTNIVVEDEKIDGTEFGKIFKYASFVYNYEFTSNLDENKCYLLYTFKKVDAANGNVTYGDEIKAGVDYLDQYSDKTDTTDPLYIAIENAKTGTYIPYIYKVRNIYVNPKNGDIKKGCGTYEDPYIIENAKQLLTLYLYLTDKTMYESMFVGDGTATGRWNVNPVGGDDGDKAECSNNVSGNTGHTSKKYGDAGFPSRIDLSTAYYKLAGDIYLNDPGDMNDSFVTDEFIGIGSEKYPFAGVLIGTKNDSENYKIVLAEQGIKTVVNDDGTFTDIHMEQSSFGLFNCLGGAVVKNVDIEGANYDADSYYNITDASGVVASKIIGGDNIIDNVKVAAKYNVNLNYQESIRGVGGLVGVVENGGLILRNMDETNANKCHFINYGIRQSSFVSFFGGLERFYEATGLLEGYTYSGNFNEKIGIYVGAVEDGYVIYDGYDYTGEGSAPVVLDRSEIAGSTRYTSLFPLVNGFKMINGNEMKSAVSTGRITFTRDAGDSKKYIVAINNTEELEAFTLALNSDSLSVFYSENNDKDTGYGFGNRCRKAEYNDVGDAAALTSADRDFALKYDDNRYENGGTNSYVGYLYPYMCYEFFDYTALSSAGATALDDGSFAANNYEGYRKTISEITGDKTEYISNINKTSDNVADYSTTYVLSKNGDDSSKDYNLKIYDISFRGIGGIYSCAYSDFRANFDGNDNNISFELSRKYDPQGIMYSGLFNQLTYNSQENMTNATSDKLEIKNINIKNSIVYNPKNYDEVFTTSYVDTNGIHSPATGMLCGQMEGCWLVDNIKVTRDEARAVEYAADVSGYKNVGGLVGRVNNTAVYTTNNTMFMNDETWYNENNDKSNKIKISNCEIKGSTADYEISVLELGTTLSGENYNNAQTTNGYSLVSVGGIIGGIGTDIYAINRTHLFGTVEIEACDISRMNVTALKAGNVGGMVGDVGARYKINYRNGAGAGTAGTVIVDGSDGGEKTKSKIEYLTVNSQNNYSCTSSGGDSDGNEENSMGGLFGKVVSTRNVGGGILTVKNYDINNINIGNYTTTGKVNQRSAEKKGYGGIAGMIKTYEVNVENVNVGTNNQSEENKIGNEAAASGAGGFFGTVCQIANENDSNKEFRACCKLNIYNSSANNTKVTAKYNSIGGIVGWANIGELHFGNAEKPVKVNNCNIVMATGYSGGENVNAGGVFGMIYHNKTSYIDSSQNGRVDYYLKNVHVIDTNVSDGVRGTGGIFGFSANSGYSGFLHMEDCFVYSTETGTSTIYNEEFAGGFFGKNNTNNGWQFIYTGKNGIGSYYDYENDEWVGSSNTGICVGGRIAGGLVGVYYDKNDSNKDYYGGEIRISNSVIYSYRDNTSGDIYSGGLIGQYFLQENNKIVKMNEITVCNNAIVTGVSKKTKDKSNMVTAAGGLYGYQSCSASNAEIYLPKVTMIDNSIGYYDVAQTNRTFKVDDWKTITNTSTDVKLFESSGSTPVAVNYRDIADINDSNIGNYALSFGTFVGRDSYSYKTTTMMYVLDPKVSYSQSVGSIPVVDVGNNSRIATANQKTLDYQNGYPFLYRSYIHIVYLDDMSGTDFTDVSGTSYSDSLSGRRPKYIADELIKDNYSIYHFAAFADDVSAYRTLNEGVADQATKNYNYIVSKRLNAYMPYNNVSTKYALCTTDNNYYDATYDVEDSDGNPGANIMNGVPVLVLDGLNPQQVADYAAFILTNGGGVVGSSTIQSAKTANNTHLNDFWKIEVENAYIDTDGSIKKINASDPLLGGHSVTSIEVSDSNRLSLTTGTYDELYSTADGIVYTISLLKYIYTCPGSEDTSVKTLYIPVYVKAKVLMDQYTRILSNAEFSLKNVQENGYKTEVSISHDSTYTVYAEFVYDGVRNNSSFANNIVNKSLDYDANADVIIAGTKYTLVDYQTGIAYYYVANGEENNTIPFSSFMDRDGNNYVQRNISSGITTTFNEYSSIGYKDHPGGAVTYSDDDMSNGIGVERYFIVIEPPEIKNNSIFTLRIETAAKDINGNNVNEFFNKNTYQDNEDVDEDGIDITYLPGPMIQFGGVDSSTRIGTDGVTFIKGLISKDKTVDIDTNVEIVLSEDGSSYWDEKSIGNTIDSANSGKYIEVAVTLLDESGEIVAWPAGTNISFNGEQKKILDNNLVIYSYKDYNKKFAMDNVDNDLTNECYYYDIGNGTNNMRWVHKNALGRYYYFADFNGVSWTREYVDDFDEANINMSNQMHISLDFSSADIDDYAGKNYTVMAKIYRSDDPDYPNDGSTSMSRQYSDIISSESEKTLAAAVSADDMMDLGINRYNEATSDYSIPFTNKFDFSTLMHSGDVDSSVIDADIAKIDDTTKEYLVTYRIYKKVNNNGMTASTDISYNNDIGNTIVRSSEYKYERIDWDESPFTLCDSDGNVLSSEDITVNVNGETGVGEEQNVIRTVKAFTADEIKNGTEDEAGNSTEYVTHWGMELKADCSGFNDEDLTNYMVTVTYIPYDKASGTPLSDNEETLYDYFIFTIAKLKTDL